VSDIIRPGSSIRVQQFTIGCHVFHHDLGRPIGTATPPGNSPSPAPRPPHQGAVGPDAPSYIKSFFLPWYVAVLTTVASEKFFVSPPRLKYVANAASFQAAKAVAKRWERRTGTAADIVLHREVAGSSRAGTKLSMKRSPPPKSRGKPCNGPRAEHCPPLPENAWWRAVRAAMTGRRTVSFEPLCLCRGRNARLAAVLGNRLQKPTSGVGPGTCTGSRRYVRRNVVKAIPLGSWRSIGDDARPTHVSDVCCNDRGTPPRRGQQFLLHAPGKVVPAAAMRGLVPGLRDVAIGDFRRLTGFFRFDVGHETRRNVRRSDASVAARPPP